MIYGRSPLVLSAAFALGTLVAACSRDASSAPPSPPSAIDATSSSARSPASSLNPFFARKPLLPARTDSRGDAGASSGAGTEAGAAAALGSSPAGSPSSNVPPVEVETLVGPLRIVREDPLHSSMTLLRATIFPPSCEADASATCGAVAGLRDRGALSLVKKWDTPKSTLVLVQSDLGGGNACNGGPMFFVALVPGSTPRYSGVLDFCGGPPPTVRDDAGHVRISWPAHPPNEGAGRIAGERWVLDRTTLALTKER
jgi:hypothetical protein